MLRLIGILDNRHFQSDCYLLGMLTLSFCFLACERPSPPDINWDEQVVESEVRQMLDEYHAAIAKGGLTAEFDYLDQTEDFFWVPPGYQNALTYDTVEAILRRNAVGFRAISFAWDSLQVFPLSASLASYTGTLGGYMIDTAGQRSDVSMIESGVLVKREDGWKLLCGQSRGLE